MAGHADLVLGLDVSTQSLKAVFLELAPSSSGDDEDVPPPIALPSAATVAAAHTLDAPTTLAPGSRVLAEIEVPYREIWPPERVLTCSPTTHRVTQTATMFVTALERCLDECAARGLPLHRVRAIAGAAQQHGSVYLTGRAESVLAGLQPACGLPPQVTDALAWPECPIWMDASTQVQCAQLERAAGGAASLARTTGSRAHARFTGAQVLKIAQEARDVWAATEHIMLISNFMASLLVGRLVPAELADASGMNLVDIHRHAYAHPILDALLAAGAAPADLVSKLPLLIHSSTQVGSVHPYYCARWGFAPTCVVMPFTGDNPSTLTAFTWRSSDSDVVISLGTSDTLMALVRSTGGDAARMESKSEDCLLMGHRFIQPITTGCVTTDATAHMTLLCYQNGDFVRAAACRALLSHPTAPVGDSVHRAAVATALTSADWETFADAVLEYSARMSSACVDPRGAALPPLVFDMQQPEITPMLPARPPIAFVCEPDASRGCVRSTPVSLLSAAQVAHGVLASRLLGMRAHAAASGLHAPTRCILTGGASRNRAIAQMVADVWGVPTFGAATGTTNAAAIGAALRATMAVPACASAAAPSAMPLHAVAQPQCCAVRMYARMATLYEGAEAALRAGCGLPAS